MLRFVPWRLSALSTDHAQSGTMRVPARSVVLVATTVGLAMVACSAAVAVDMPMPVEARTTSVSPSCVDAVTTTTCVGLPSRVSAQQLSTVLFPYVELLQEFGLNPPSRFFATVSDDVPRGFTRVVAPAASSPDVATLNRVVADTIAAPVDCPFDAPLAHSAMQGRSLLAEWLLHQVTGAVPHGSTAAQRSWFASNASNEWVLANYPALAACSPRSSLPAVFAGQPNSDDDHGQPVGDR